MQKKSKMKTQACFRSKTGQETRKSNVWAEQKNSIIYYILYMTLTQRCLFTVGKIGLEADLIIVNRAYSLVNSDKIAA